MTGLQGECVNSDKICSIKQRPRKADLCRGSKKFTCSSRNTNHRPTERATAKYLQTSTHYTQRALLLTRPDSALRNAFRVFGAEQSLHREFLPHLPFPELITKQAARHSVQRWAQDSAVAQGHHRRDEPGPQQLPLTRCQEPTAADCRPQLGRAWPLLWGGRRELHCRLRESGGDSTPKSENYPPGHTAAASNVPPL